MIGNTATRDGGGLDNPANLSVESGVWMDNSAARGGAVHQQPEGVIDLIDVLLVHNSATEDGGALANDGITRVAGSTFERNSAYIRTSVERALRGDTIATCGV